MRSFKIALAVLVWAVWAVPGLPQTQELQKEALAALDKQHTQERYEQIEILRRLLDHDLSSRDPGGKSPYYYSSFYLPDGKLMASTTTDGGVRVWDVNSGKQIHSVHAAMDRATLQGFYLKGQGVVYTTTLPAGTLVSVVDGGVSVTEKPLTEWERVRSEVRGEKQEPKKPKTNPSLSDLLLKTLAENGKYMTQLPEGESITVAVTLASMQTCTSCHVNPGTSTSTGTTSTGGATATSTSTTSRTEKLFLDLAEVRNAAKQIVLLGDLHLRQKKFHEASEAFLKASESYTKALEFFRSAALEYKGKLPLTDSELELDLLECRTKLAQAFVGEGKPEEARKLLALIAAQAQRGAQGDTAKPAEKAVLVLPSKLIVTASKKSLEAVGSGKMSFEEFRRAATIEYLTFDKGPEKTPAKP